jgi:hypothetical protein
MMPAGSAVTAVCSSIIRQVPFTQLQATECLQMALAVVQCLQERIPSSRHQQRIMVTGSRDGCNSRGAAAVDYAAAAMWSTLL